MVPARTQFPLTRRTFGATALLLAASAVAPRAARAPQHPPVAHSAALLSFSSGGVRPAGPAPRAPELPVVLPRTEWDPRGNFPRSSGRRTRPARIHLHHTHEPTVSSPGEVAEALRSVCRSHRQRGFDDIGYHWAIDPYGRIWATRGTALEDLGERVRNGAHAQGFNDNSLGVVLIGDHEVTAPTAEATRALEQLVAWLVWRYDLDPHGTVPAVSTGGPSTRFAEGQRVTLPVLAGHRDTGAGTACPGQHAYDMLPSLRNAVATRLAEATAA